MDHSVITRAKSIAARIFSERVRNVLKAVWMVVVTAFVVRYVVRNWDELYDTVSSFSGLVLLSTVLVTMGGKVVISVHSQLITRVNGTRFSFRESFWMYSASDLVKYVPGGLWNALARVRLYTARGMTPATATKAFALEKYWMLVGALGTGAVALTPDLLDRIGVEAGTGAVWSVRIALVVALFAAMWIGGRVSGRHLQPRDVVRAIVEQSVMAVLFGLGVSIPLSAVHAHVSTTTAIGAFSMGRGLGYVAVFAPAGIGVREVVTLWALGKGHGAATDTMLIALAVNRVMTFVADLATFGSSLVVRPSRTGEVIESP